MSAQSTLLGMISDNVANVDTVGYKGVSADFSSLVLNTGIASDYQSGSVNVTPNYAIDAQGTITSTTSVTDLAIQGKGFFIVSQNQGQQYLLTRAGNFSTDKDGNLVNAGGYTLYGYPATGSAAVANGYNGLVPVNLTSLQLQATPTTSGKLYVNLPSSATAVTDAADLPSNNLATATPTEKTSLVTYDDLGNQVKLDVYFTYTGSDTWEADVFNSADATNGGFPYNTPATGTEPMATANLTFDPTTGALASGSPTSLSIAIPGGSQSMTLDLSQSTQLAEAYTVNTATANGSDTSQVENFTIGTTGVVSAVYQNGQTVPEYTIPLATVASPDSMTTETGNAYEQTTASGPVTIGTAGSAGLGTIQSSSLEQSTVDLADELTSMISAQNNYQANSKLFSTGSQLLQVLINLGH
jgi:flagellar hook protein FlgE